MTIVQEIFLFWSLVAVVWAVCIGPICIYFGAKIFRYQGLSYLRSVAISVLFSVAAGLASILSSTLLDFLDGPTIAHIIINVILAFVIGVLIFKWLAQVRIQDALRIFGICYALMFVFEAAFVTVFLFDEDLRPEVAQELAVTPDEDPESNMFYSLIGFSVEPGRDAHRIGRQKIESFNRALQKNPALLSFPEDEVNVKLERYEDLNEMLEEKPRLGQLVADDVELIHSVYKANQDFLDAYRDLRRFKRIQYAATPHVSSPIPNYLVILRANRLILSEARADFLTGEREEAVEALKGEIAFGRLLIAESDTMIGKMISVALLKRCYKVYAEMLDDEEFVGQAALLTDEIANLSREEWSLEEAMRWEFRALAGTMRGLNHRGFQEISENEIPLPNSAVTLFWKENSSVNLIYPWYDQRARSFNEPAHQYAQQRTPPGLIETTWSDTIFNPIGVILMQIAVPSFDRYFHRMFTLEGEIRLVRLKQEIRKQGLTVDSIAGFIAGASDDLRNPYTLEPMNWNAEKRILSFARPDDDDCSGEIEIPELTKLQGSLPAKTPNDEGGSEVTTRKMIGVVASRLKLGGGQVGP